MGGKGGGDEGRHAPGILNEERILGSCTPRHLFEQQSELLWQAPDARQAPGGGAGGVGGAGGGEGGVGGRHAPGILNEERVSPRVV